MRLVKCPVLFIHGGNDDIVPLSEMEALFEAANEPKEKAVIEGADHGLDPKNDQMIETILRWLKKTL